MKESKKDSKKTKKCPNCEHELTYLTTRQVGDYTEKGYKCHGCNAIIEVLE